MSDTNEESYRKMLDYIRIKTPRGDVELTTDQKELAMKLYRLNLSGKNFTFTQHRRHNYAKSLNAMLDQHENLSPVVAKPIAYIEGPKMHAATENEFFSQDKNVHVAIFEPKLFFSSMQQAYDKYGNAMNRLADIIREDQGKNPERSVATDPKSE